MRRYGYQQRAHADRRADAAVRARPGRGDRHRREGDVLLHRQHERRPADAAPRGHGRRRARDDRAHALYDGGKRLYYIGPMFRHERPQRGRYRQFHQVGVEALGFAGPDVDAEVILMCARAVADLGLPDVRLELNSLGQADERARAPRGADRALRGATASSSTPTPSAACTATRCASSTPRTRRCRPLVEAAPQLMDFLGEASLKHFDACARCSTPPASPTASTRAWCAAWTTTT